jgi:hypothetical protein
MYTINKTRANGCKGATQSNPKTVAQPKKRYKARVKKQTQVTRVTVNTSATPAAAASSSSSGGGISSVPQSYPMPQQALQFDIDTLDKALTASISRLMPSTPTATGASQFTQFAPGPTFVPSNAAMTPTGVPDGIQLSTPPVLIRQRELLKEMVRTSYMDVAEGPPPITQSPLQDVQMSPNFQPLQEPIPVQPTPQTRLPKRGLDPNRDGFYNISEAERAEYNSTMDSTSAAALNQRGRMPEYVRNNVFGQSRLGIYDSDLTTDRVRQVRRIGTPQRPLLPLIGPRAPSPGRQLVRYDQDELDALP